MFLFPPLHSTIGTPDQLLGVPFPLNHRHIAIAVASNLAGNALIGRGGGIGLVAGMSKIIKFHAYIAVAAVAIAPLPL